MEQDVAVQVCGVYSVLDSVGNPPPIFVRVRHLTRSRRLTFIVSLAEIRRRSGFTDQHLEATPRCVLRLKWYDRHPSTPPHRIQADVPPWTMMPTRVKLEMTGPRNGLTAGVPTHHIIRKPLIVHWFEIGCYMHSDPTSVR